jgi:hypothetical protein
MVHDGRTLEDFIYSQTSEEMDYPSVNNDGRLGRQTEEDIDNRGIVRHTRCL